MAYRNKTYVCFDGDTDMHYYRMMMAWSENKSFSFSFYNAHDLNSARDGSQEESIKRQLRERLNNSKLFVVLIGEKTRFLTKFVKWEMEAALRLKLPIIGVNLDGSRRKNNFCPPTISSELVVYVPFNAKIIEYAMDNWPADCAKRREANQMQAFCYVDEVYKSLGLSR